MLTFHSLILRHRHTVCDDAVCLEFEAPAEAAGQYAFHAGQHLSFRAVLDGTEVRRSYSIVSPPNGALRIGVRLQGRMSKYLGSELPIGGVIEAMEPTGRFRAAVKAAEAVPRRYVAFAAGSGITPILSIVTDLLDSHAQSSVQLFYGNRTLSRTMFLEELLALKNRYLDRFSLQFIMSGEPQDVEIFNGRIDAERIAKLAANEFDVASVDEFFVCGPGSMVRAVIDSLRALGAPGKIHFERFSADTAAAPPVRSSVSMPVAGATEEVDVSVTLDGRRRRFKMGRDELVLEAAERAGISLPFSCRAGVCSTCRVQVTGGEVAMDRNQALEDWEISAGYVLCCQARPVSDQVDLNYDNQ
jgi:ring-1,2-phenylacetyl-CoA epoxidase subunit PaaE